MNKVDNPILQPYRCLFCTAGHKGGPVIDCLVDVLEGRAYLCLQHTKRAAVAAGFAKGPELDKLENAALLLAEAEKGIAERDVKMRVAESDIDDLETDNAEIRAERDQARIALKQAEAKLAELGQGIGATLAAVGARDHIAELQAAGVNLDHLKPSPAEAAEMAKHAAILTAEREAPTDTDEEQDE